MEEIFDKLVIYGGRRSVIRRSDMSLMTLSGRKSRNYEFTILENVITLYFESDVSNRDRGFSLTFTAGKSIHVWPLECDFF